MSYAGADRHRSALPESGNRAQDDRGIGRAQVPYPTPKRSIVPGEKFSTTTSDLSASFIKQLRAFRRHQIERDALLAAINTVVVAGVAAGIIGAKPRESSPRPGTSILMTSAPRSARFIVQNGPASTRVRSMTRIPASGFCSITLKSSSPFNCDLDEAFARARLRKSRNARRARTRRVHPLRCLSLGSRRAPEQRNHHSFNCWRPRMSTADASRLTIRTSPPSYLT